MDLMKRYMDINVYILVNRVLLNWDLNLKINIERVKL